MTDGDTGSEAPFSTNGTTRVLIVGGGSAGWITASYLDALLNRRAGQQRVQITLVESDRIGRIGVGESTIPTIIRTLRQVGIAERDFMRCANATFKQAIRFVDWGRKGERFFHPFTRHSNHRNDPKGLDWLLTDRSIPFAEAVTPQARIADHGLSPKFLNSKDFQSPFNYAYHIDAERFAKYLCDLAVSRGVSHVVDDVVDVDLRDNGDVAAVLTKDGRRLEADLFIDCTGFARRLIGSALGGGFTSYEDCLLCDSALAAQVSYELYEPETLDACTTSTALSSGWVWDIPLQDRRGVGYVYSSQFQDDESAESEFRAFEGAHAKDVELRKISFRTGHVAEPWTRNCVAIGLAAGFIEPLESTGIFFIEDGVDLLCELFPRLGDIETCRNLYNATYKKIFKENADFINIHYCLTKRRDTPFWREVSKPERIFDSVKERLALWETKPPSRLDFGFAHGLYGYLNFEYVMYGMGWAPSSMAEVVPGATPTDRSSIAKSEAEAFKAFLPQKQFLPRYLGLDSSQPSATSEPALPPLDPMTALMQFRG